MTKVAQQQQQQPLFCPLPFNFLLFPFFILFFFFFFYFFIPCIHYATAAGDRLRVWHSKEILLCALIHIRTRNYSTYMNERTNERIRAKEKKRGQMRVKRVEEEDDEEDHCDIIRQLHPEWIAANCDRRGPSSLRKTTIPRDSTEMWKQPQQQQQQKGISWSSKQVNWSLP